MRRQRLRVRASTVTPRKYTASGCSMNPSQGAGQDFLVHLVPFVPSWLNTFSEWLRRLASSAAAVALRQRIQ